MSYGGESFPAAYFPLAAEAKTNERAGFLVKTYMHLAGAIAAFVALEFVLFALPITESLVGAMFGSPYSWLLVLGGFMVVSFIADYWARSSTSVAMQYAGLSLFVVAESIIFVPLLYLAGNYSASIIPTAAITTGCLFAGLTLIVLWTRADLSWMRRILFFGGIAAFGFIICAVMTGFELGPIFIYAMIALACGYILFHTSNVLHHYRIGQHVAASLALFSSVALLLWYVIQLFMSSDN